MSKDLPSIDDFEEDNNLPSIDDYINEESVNNLPSIEDFEEEENFPLLEEISLVEELPSIEDFIVDEEIEEETQTIEDVEGNTFAEIKDIVPPWPELVKMINDVREEIPNIPEIKYYDKELEELAEQIVNLPEVRYYDREIEAICEQIDLVREQVKDLPEVKYYDEQVDAIEDRIKNLPEIKHYDSEIVAICESIDAVKETIPNSSLIDENFSSIEEDFVKVNDAIDGLRGKIEFDLERLSEDIEVKYFNNSVKIGSNIKELDDKLNILVKEEKDKIWKELQDSSTKIWEYHKEFKDDDRKLKKQILGEYNKLRKNIEERLEEVSQESIKTDELLLKYFIELREEFTKLPEIKYYDKDIDYVKSNIKGLHKIVEDIKSSQKKLQEEQKLLAETNVPLTDDPPETNNSDPLTPIDQNFVTLDQLQKHYKTFVQRVQHQLSSIGGGGETRLEFLDDIDRSTALIDGRVLQYDASAGIWTGGIGGSGGGGSQTLDDTLGLGNTSDIGMSVGIVTATSFSGDGADLTGIVTSIVAGNNITISGSSGRVTINSHGGGGGSQDLDHTLALGNISGIGMSVGVVTTTELHVGVDTGFFTEDLVVNGDTRITGILTIGTASVTLDGVSETVQVGSALTLGHSIGLQFHTQSIHVDGFEALNINSSGVVTATTFDGSLATSNLVGSLTNDQLSGSIENSKLSNSTVSYGGVQLSLGGSDATPAFDLSDATNYPYSSLTGITTDIVGDATPQLGGNLDVNGNDITGTGNVNLSGIITASSANFSGNVSIGGTLTYEDVTNIDSVGLITARTGIRVLAGGINAVGVVTAASFDGSLATTDLTGTITNAQLAGSIENSKLSNSTVSYGGIQLSLGGSDATPAFDLSDATNYPYSSLTGISTNIVGDTTPQLGGNLDVNSNDITGTGNVNLSGIVTATTFSGNLPTTDLTGTITNAQLAGSIENSKLSNSTVSYGGVELSLGGSDDTPAFDLSDAINYPYNSLTGISTNIVGDNSPQLGGNLDVNNNDITGTGNVNLTGIITATTFDGSLATTDLTGTITNAQLAGSIENSKLSNSTVSYGGIQLSLGGSDATPAFDLSDATNYPYDSLTGITTNIVGDTTPQLGGNLDVNGNDITGTGDINLTGIATATSFSGDGSTLSGIVTSITAGNNISISGATGNVTITGLANTANVISDTIDSGILNVTGVSTLSKLHVDPVGSGITYNEDLVVLGNARVTGILSIGTSSIVLDANAKTIRGLNEIRLDSTETDEQPVIIKQTDGKISFRKTSRNENNQIVEVEQEASVGIGTTVSVNTSGIITATSFSGDGSTLSGIVTSITAGDNISIDSSTGNVTITGLANTANVVSDTIDTGSLSVTGITTLAGNTNISGNITSNVTIVSTDTGSSAAPEFTLYRNSASPAPGDYLGQIMFKGENSNGGQENYAKITAKISDETLGTEDGLIETAIKGDGSFTIVSRQRSDELQLINGVGLDVDGTSTFGNNVTVNADISNTGTAIFGSSSGVGTVSVGVGATALLVEGDTRITGILTVGTSSLTLDGSDETIQVGAALTLGHSIGLQFHTQSIHVDGFEALNINSSGIVTATTFSGNLPTTDLTGTITNAQLAGSIENSKLSNSTVSYGGVQLSLGGSDATPAFDLSDATNYPTSSLSGTITNDQLAGSIANGKLANSTISYGGVQLSLGGSDATPAFDLSDATNYPYDSLTGITTSIVGDTTPQLGGNLDLNSNDITGTGNINITGDISATTVSIAGTLTYEDVTNVDSVGLITARSGIDALGETTITASSTSALFIKDNSGDSSGLKLYSDSAGLSHINAGYGNLVLETSGTERFRIDSGGNVNITGVCTATSFVGTASTATTVTVTPNGDNTTYRVPFTSGVTGDISLYTDTSDGMTYNPSTNTLVAGYFSGNGSNLTSVDADTLDGVQGSSFVRNDVGSQQVQSYLTINNSGNFSVLEFEDASNVQRTHVYHANSGGYAGIGVFDSSGANRKDLLLYQNGTITWNSNTVWHAGNDGSGSGLDADTLDGIQGASFLRSDANDTATGALTIGNAVYTNYTSSDTDITGLVAGSNFGSLIESSANAHLVVGIRDNDAADSFSVVSGSGNYMTDSTYDKLVFQARADGALTANGGNTIWHAGNDGSGSGLDADTLDGIQGSNYLRSDIDDSTSGYLVANGFVGSGGALRIANPGGASFATNASTTTGYLKVTLPVSWTNTMMSMTIKCYEYATGESFDIHCGGYNYAASSSWFNTFAYIIGGNTTNRNFTVRFGHDGSKCAIYIGESNSTWSYFQFGVFDFLGGYSNYTGASWHTGWSCSITTTLGTITGTTFTTTQLNKYVDGNTVWHAGNDGSGSGLDADTVDGVQLSGLVRSQTASVLGSMLTLGSQSSNYRWNNGTNGRPADAQANEFGTLLHLDYDGSRASQFAWDIQADNLYLRTLTYSTDTGTTWKKVWTDGNDGSGSGLDADTVDGIQADRIPYGANTFGTTGSTNPGQNLRSGFFDVYGTANGAPTNTWYSYINIRHTNTSNGWGHQIAGSFYDNGELYNRHYDSGNYAGWTKIWNAANDGSGSGLDADTLDGIQSTGFLQTFYETALNSPDASGGSWVVNSNTTDWGQPKFGNSFSHRRYADGGSAYVQYNIPSGYKSCWISQLQWSSGGYADCYGVQSDGDLIFLKRINTRQLVENSNHGDPNFHDGSTITHIGSGLEHYTAIRIQNRSGRIHLTGIAWTKNENVGYEGTGMVHPAQISHQGSGSGLDADTVDGIQGASFLRSDATDSFTGTITNSGNFISVSNSVSAANFNKIRFGRSSSQFMSFYGDSGGSNMIAVSSSGNPKANVKVGYSVDGGATVANTYTFTGSSGTVWTAGNDGAGSGLDADTLDGVNSGSFLRSDAFDIFDGTTSGRYLRFQCFSGRTANSSSGNLFPLEVFQATANTDAAITFHIGSDYAAYFGLDGTTNDLFWGGWSRGAAKYKVWHAANDGAGSGLDADSLDGYTWASSGKQVRASDFYADNWFRNYNSGEGLYNQATTQYFYSDSDDGWNIAGGTGANWLRFRDEYNGTIRGYLYADTASSIGFLNSAAQWGLRYLSSDGLSPNLYFREQGNETWTGNPGNDIGKVEYHSNRFYIAAGANSTEVCVFRRSGSDVVRISNGGTITASGDVTAFSDITLKEDIEVIPNALDKVSQIRGVTFIRKDLDDKSRKSGVIAQDVEKVFPEVVSTTEDGTKTVAYGNMVGLLIEALKEQKEIIKDQQKQIDDLRKRIDEKL